jgi:subtilisin family serine protease
MSEIPAWALEAGVEPGSRVAPEWPRPLTREWAWGGSTGAGVRVCVVDSGVEAAHPLVGTIDEAWVSTVGEDDEVRVARDPAGDVCGHGTACAGIVRALAPDCSISSVRVLGESATGGARELVAGLRFAVEQGFDIIDLSLSTTRRPFASALHELADAAYFNRCLVVACAHNAPVESFPWRFSSVISVASHSGTDPLEFYVNDEPPVEFFARGVDVEIGWLGGGTIRASGNSFAAPHVAALCALVRAKHPELTPYEVKTVLAHVASNVVARA